MPCSTLVWTLAFFAIPTVAIVVRADVQGSVEVIKKAVEDISTDEVRVRCLFAAVGGVTESDVTLASASAAETSTKACKTCSCPAV